MNDNTTKIGGAILIGGLIGAAIAVLYAPKSGRRTRKDIIRAARRVKNSATDLIEDTIDNVHDIISDLQGKASDVLERGEGLTDKARKEIISTLEEGQKTIEKQKQRFSEALGKHSG
jgi:gas vesicle protein